MKLWLIIVASLVFANVFSQQCECNALDNCDSVSQGIHFKYKQHTQKFSNALNYASFKYPELTNFNLEIKRKKISTMMAARPKRNFLFHNKANRTYVILITDKSSMNADQLFNEMSSCAITGVIGHELSHITTYSTKSNYKLLCFGFRYLFNKKEIETETDLLAVKHGFGSELIEYNQFIHNSPLVNKKYLHRKSKYYLSASELNASIHSTL
jgi:hypothetical protein